MKIGRYFKKIWAMVLAVALLLSSVSFDSKATGDGEDPYASVVVTITGHVSDVYFDTKEHSVSGYDVSIDNPLYTAEDFICKKNPTISGRNIGSYAMGLKASDFVNQNEDFKQVIFRVQDGKLKISPQEYAVKFVTNGGTFLETPIERYTRYVGAQLPIAVEKEGHIFDGWYTNSQCSGSSVTEITAEDFGKKTFYAKWLVQTYTISFDTHGGSAIDDLQVEFGKLLPTIQMPARDHYTFEGWYLDAQYTKTYSPYTEVRNNMTLYAKWTPNPELYQGIWIQEIAPQTYTGKAIKPQIEVYDGGRLLKEGKDYSITYKNNKKAHDGIVKKNIPSVVIKGMGNYTNDSSAAYFVIQPKSIADADISCADMLLRANGKVRIPVPKLYWNGKKLSAGDYAFAYFKDASLTEPAQPKDPGIYYCRITGKGNFCGQRVVTFTLAETYLISKASVSGLKSQEYQNGKSITPTFQVKYSNKILIGVPKNEYTGDMKVDYIYEYADNCAVGEGKVLIHGKGSFVGTLTATFKIKPIENLKNAAVKGIGNDYVYTGEPYTPQTELYIRIGGVPRRLEKNIDYTVSYENNVNAGTATIVYTGIGGYTGTKREKFKIAPYNLEEEKYAAFPLVDISLGAEDATSYPYEKGGTAPKIYMTYHRNLIRYKMEQNKDFTVNYQNHTSVSTGNANGLPTAIIKGKGNFTGTIKREYIIYKQNLNQLQVEVPDVAYNTARGGFKSTPIITDVNGKKLVPGVDYAEEMNYYYIMQNTEKVTLLGKIEDDEIVAKGKKIAVVVKGINNYAGSELVVAYYIKASSIGSMKATVKQKTYTGSEITLTDSDITMMDDDYKLVLGRDYLITGYSNNINKGTAKVTIKGINNYAGSKTLSFKINPKKFLWWAIG